MIVTPIYAGILALLFFVLSYRVILLRGHGASLGDGGNPVLLRRIRAHGNFSEYVPFILLMIGMLELSHFSIYVLHALGVTLVVARLLLRSIYKVLRDGVEFQAVAEAGKA